MFKFKRTFKRTLKIVCDNQTHKIYPGDTYVLNVDIEMFKNKTTMVVKAPITFIWDGRTLRKVDGP